MKPVENMPEDFFDIIGGEEEYLTTEDTTDVSPGRPEDFHQRSAKPLPPVAEKRRGRGKVVEGSSRALALVQKLADTIENKSNSEVFIAPLPLSFKRQGEDLYGIWAFGSYIYRFEFERAHIDTAALHSVSLWDTGQSLDGAPSYIVSIEAGKGKSIPHIVGQIADELVNTLVDPHTTEMAEATKPHNRIEESVRDDIAEFIQSTGIDLADASIAGLHRDYTDYAEENGLSVPHQAYFRTLLNQIKSGETTSGPKISVKAGVADDSASTPEFDDFEKNVLNSEILLKYEMMHEVYKRVVQWDPMYKNVFIYGVGGVGKANWVESKVLTPRGRTRMGDLKVGDQVTTPSGEIANITEVHPQGVMPLYRVTLRDGASTLVTEQHLFSVSRQDRRNMKRLNGKTIGGLRTDTLSVKQMLELGLTFKRLGSEKFRFSLPYSAPYAPAGALGPEELPIHPYVLGVLLGDGGLTGHSPGLTSADPFIVETCNKLLAPTGAEFEAQPSQGPYAYTCVGDTSLKQQLKELELMGKGALEKSIPSLYMENASVESKVFLLQGLMDTDGGAFVCSVRKGKANYVSQYATISEQLKDDFVFLVRSLGGKATVNKYPSWYYNEKRERVPCKDHYRATVTFANDINPYLLPRKAELWRTTHQQTRAIVSIEPAFEAEAQCITIDSNDHLYVVDDFIVTHNSFGLKKVVEKYANPDEIKIYKGTVAGFTGLLQILWENRTRKIIVLDDNDTVLSNDTAVNILKGAMDSDEPRIISYSRMKRKKKEAGIHIDGSQLHEGLVSIRVDDQTFTESITPKEKAFYKKLEALTEGRSFESAGKMLYEDYDDDDDGGYDADFEGGDLDPDTDPAYGLGGDSEIPDQFQFTSRVIFISNLLTCPQPILDRTISVGLFLSKEQILDLIENLLDPLLKDELPELTLETKKEALAFMRKYVHRINVPLTFRFFGKICAFFHNRESNPKAVEMAYLAMRGDSMMKTKLR